jgi:ammonia channel protein AmtB
MWAGLVFGVTAAFVCYLVLSIRRLDDFLEEPLDISIIHGAGGLWGMFLTGIFAE